MPRRHRDLLAVVIVLMAAGLRLEALQTSNGPDLHVYLSSTPASSSWYG